MSHTGIPADKFPVTLDAGTWLIVAQACGRAAVDPQQTLYDQLTASAASERILITLQAYREGEALDGLPPWQ